MRYGRLCGGIAYAAVYYAGWSLVLSDNHHEKNVFAGAGIGIVSAAIFYKTLS